MSAVSKRTKFAYGLGQIGEQVKNQGFGAFLFFYFTQVLGLSGSLAGTAILIALIFDAVTDPVAGSLSDNWKGSRGRRHPFMYAAALPLGITYVILFNPPAYSQTGLFIWLTVFAIAVRGAMTLYHVPHLAMGAELSDDYQERTSIVAWRTMLAVVGGGLVTIASYRLFFPETAQFENGMLNPDGYSRYSVFAAVIMIVTIWYSAYGTRDRIPELPKAPESPERFSFRRIVTEFGSAWENISFRSLFVGFTLFGIFFGVLGTLGTHINVFFWEFGTGQLQFLVLPALIGFALGSALVGPLHKRFDKLPTLMFGCIASAFVGNAAIVLRLLGVFPENGSVWLLPVVFVLLLINTTIAATSFVSAGSMMADVAEQHVLRSGKAQQGIFFSATSFSGKLASGFGHFIAGVGLDWIAFPLESKPSEVSSEAIQSLGLLNLSAGLITIVAIWVFRYYAIDRDVQLETRRALVDR
ncbi:MAG: MFS transporter [Myxococcota bacterium]|nr:MFS transporter [Myxococcota bacterium]